MKKLLKQFSELDHFEQLEVLQYAIFIRIRHRLDVSEKGRIMVILNY